MSTPDEFSRALRPDCAESLDGREDANRQGRTSFRAGRSFRRPPTHRVNVAIDGILACNAGRTVQRHDVLRAAQSAHAFQHDLPDEPGQRVRRPPGGHLYQVVRLPLFTRPLRQARYNTSS
ncbi:MAG: hypothetical protein INR62_05890 [Rhodospirillales bacterium]|nr:hypothetical protein [Acetobacter sp.]